MIWLTHFQYHLWPTESPSPNPIMLNHSRPEGLQESLPETLGNLQIMRVDMTASTSKVHKEPALRPKLKVKRWARHSLYWMLSSQAYIWVQTVKDSDCCGCLKVWFSNLVVKRVDSEVKWPQIKSWLCLCLAGWPWTSYLSSLGLLLLIASLRGIFPVPTPGFCCEYWMR